MSTFSLKLIAVITMLIDHSSILFYNCGFIPLEVYLPLRGIGRISFPIFCFLLVKGFSFSSNREKYLGRLMSFALISQIPFSVYFSMAGSYKPGGLFISFETPFLFLLALIACILFFISGRRSIKQLSVLLLFIIIPGFRVGIGSIPLLNGRMNVFYSLALCLLLIYFLSEFKDKKLSHAEIILGAALIAGAMIYIQPEADYGISAVLLILGLYLIPSHRLFHCAYILIWAFLYYGHSRTGIMYLFFVMLSTFLIYFFNGKKGPSMKYFFYIFYPAHLLILSIFSALLL